LKTNILCLSARNRRNNYGEVGYVQPKDCSVWVHRTVRWCTGQCPVRQAGSGELAALGFRRRRTAINHRTVRWCTGLSGEPTVGRANGPPCNPRATHGRANGQKGAPDSVRCANGSESLTVGFAKEGKKFAPDSVRWCTTVRCARRQKARIAFLECFQRLLAALGL
jgi:ribosomal protein S26